MYVILGVSFLFIAIGFIVTEHNAKYLLAGYNTMSEEGRKKVNLKSYLSHFRKFHLFLGLSFFLFSAALVYLVGEKAGGIFLSVYPILAYLYFFWRSAKYTKGLNSYPIK